MRIMILLALHVALLFANAYDFTESKYVSAVGANFVKKGHIDVMKDKTIITYKAPLHKKIIKTDTNVTMEDSKGKLYHLKGRANFYARTFIDIMTRLGDFSKLKSNPDFDVKKDKDIYYVSFKGDIANRIVKAEVKIKNSKVSSFKMFMPNGDTLEITKR